MNDDSSRLQYDFTSSHVLKKLKLQLEDLTPRRLLVAFSGGMDSSVLLHLIATQRDNLPAPLTALHVDHGLHPNSGSWRQRCEQFCTTLSIPFIFCALQLNPQKGESVEALARDARYGWFYDFMQEGDVLLTAHHRDDQAETILLQLFRGAGVQGLAAMPERTIFAGGHLLRPLLDFSRDQISRYAHDEQLNTLDDPANFDTRFQRNVVRHEVLPLIRRHWFGIDKTLLRSASHCADAMGLLHELAENDLERVRDDALTILLSPLPPVRVDLMTSLSHERIKNLLRFWIRMNGFKSPSARKLQEIMRQLVDSKASGGCVDWDDAELRRYRNHIFLQCKLNIEQQFLIKDWFITKPIELIETNIRLKSTPGTSKGLRKSALQDEAISVRPRVGGEYIRLPNGQHRTAVKKLYQTRGIPPWIRDRLPLLYVDNQLAAIPGITIDDAFIAREGDESILINVETIT